MNRDSANKLTISSPLEAHKAETILFSVCGVDVNFDNPIFAMIEMEYTEADQDPSGEAAQDTEKKLTYYELDLGTNHVVRKWSEPIARTANFLLSVPGGDNWPSGVLICGENWVSYKHQGHVEIRTALPRRHDLPINRGVLITTGTVHKQKDLFFFLLQSEYGDLYKVTLETDPANPKIVSNLVVAVFDTIPPSNSLCITKTGLLYAASEFSNHALFQFQGIDDPTAVRSERIMDEELNEELGDDSESAARVAPLFTACSKLKNLLITDDISSLAPVTDMLVDDITGEDAQQIYALCGRGNRSTLKILRQGVSVTEMAVSELPGRPVAVWTVKKSVDDEFDRYIVVSFSNATLVLSIGETVEEVTDSGFLSNTPTLQVALLADNALLQVYSGGIRHIRADQHASEWKPPGRKIIELASVNSRQVAVALTGGDIVYFELDPTGQLIEMNTLDIGKEVSCLDLGNVPEGRVRSSFLAVGCWDQTVQLLSLDPSDVLGRGPAFGVDSKPTSISLIEMGKDTGGLGETSASAAASLTSLYLHVGSEKGVLLRVAVDPVSGDFSDARRRYLGSKPIKICRVSVRGQPSALALTTKPWLLYNHQNRYHQDPISYESLEYAADFSSKVCPDAIVAVAGNTLRIISMENLGEMFNQTSMPLQYTPRKMCRIPNTKQLVVIESDHNEFNEIEKAELLKAKASANNGMEISNGTNGNHEEKGDQNGEEEEEGTTVIIRGPVPPVDGKWASCIRIIDPVEPSVKGWLELRNNEAALSLCTCRFAEHSEETFIVVGTAQDLTLHPKKFKACYIHVYRAIEGNLQLLHQTQVEDIPLCMTEFQGRLLVGIGRILRLYDLGKMRLLKKCENKLFPNSITRLQHKGDRIYVGDLCSSILFVKYRRGENTLTIFADDTLPRYLLYFKRFQLLFQFFCFPVGLLPASAS